MIDPLEQITQQMTSTLDQGQVLAAVTRGLIEDLGAALARIWLVEPGDICSACREAPRCPNRERCLHLQASAGLSTRLDGAHRRVPIGALKIGQIALSREPMCANQIETDERITDKAWVRRNKLASFAGYPLLFQGELLGVLAMFAKRPLSGAELERLSLFANRAAIAIQNARLYTELAALKARLEAENIYLHEELRREQADGELIGESPALLEALSKLRQVAPTSSTVLLYGETGTGKELFARALHAASARRGGPLVMVNCAAIAPGLVESELFGHEKGAFTTALGRRIGRFELASGGTLLLDEVGELPLETQAKLLRVLQEREMERVGGSETLRVDVRVVAATNRDLAAEVQRGRFRADLYYRLAVFPIHVPPLRARRSDIPLLCSAFLEKQARALRKPLRGLTKDAEDRLMAYDWPGNVRELHNVIERAAILSRGDVIGIDELPDLGRGGDMSGGGSPPPGLAEPLESVAPRAAERREPRSAHGAIAGPDAAERRHGGETLKEVERDHMMRVLRGAGWVIEGPEGAAARLGMRPSTLRSRMARLEIRRPAGRT